MRSTNPPDLTPQPPPRRPTRRQWSDLKPLVLVALFLLIAATSWYLLQQLASILRPLLLAVFLCQIIRPFHKAMKHRFPRGGSYVVLAIASSVVFYAMALITH